jgi:pSer/pThr/pTyr-binding forkhead associated (FHA) protein
MWVLQSSDPDANPVTFRILPGAVKTVGRASDADLIVDAALVSRLHCRLEASADGVAVVDLSSTNGTFVNDARVEHGRLMAGDRLRIGRFELRVERAADA